jgi:N-acetylmuramoyl-L-alanine amidase
MDTMLMVKIRAEKPFRFQRRAFESRFIESVSWSEGTGHYMITIKTKNPRFNYESYSRAFPPRLIIDISPETEIKKPPQKEVRDPEFTPSVARSPMGRKTVVIDPGHGGLETGAKGKFGTLEKTVTLQIGHKLKSIIERNLSLRVVMTREKDVDVSLENRAAIANNNEAYVFISIHANGSPRRDAHGSETFFLNLNATDEEARRLAYLENNESEIGSKISSENEDDIKMILWDMAQSAFIKQSSMLAESIQNQLNALLKTTNRGIKQAPFKVLTGVACPAVLVEVAFISNPDEERALLEEDFQNRIATAIYSGLADFLRRFSQD